MGGSKRGRDMKLMSRHRLVSRRSRPGKEFATWSGLSGVTTPIRCRDMILASLMSRHRSEIATWGRLPGRVATSARPASARHALAVRATSRPCALQRPRPGHCARSVRCSAHDLGTARAVCARPGLLGVPTVHPTQF